MPGTEHSTRHRARHSIRTRVTVGATAIVTLILVVSAVLAVLVLGRVLTASVEESAEQDLDSLSSQVENDPSRAESIITGVDDDLLVRFNAAGGTGTVVNDDEADQLPEPGESSRQVTVDGEPYLVVSEDTDVGTFTVARTTEHVDETVGATTILLAVAVPLVIVLVGAVVWIVTGRALRPVERLRRQVDSITAEELSRRVDTGDDELGALATTMNRMLARLEHSQAVQRRFISDASHELRSPLATMRQHAELGASYPDATSLHELSEVVIDEGERMQNLVEGLLLLARLDENHRPPRSWWTSTTCCWRKRTGWGGSVHAPWTPPMWMRSRWRAIPDCLAGRCATSWTMPPVMRSRGSFSVSATPTTPVQLSC